MTENAFLQEPSISGFQLRLSASGNKDSSFLLSISQCVERHNLGEPGSSCSLVPGLFLSKKGIFLFKYPSSPKTQWMIEKSEFNDNWRSPCILISFSRNYIVLGSKDVFMSGQVGNSGNTAENLVHCIDLVCWALPAYEVLYDGNSFYSLLQTSASLLNMPDWCCIALQCDLDILIHHKLPGM